MFGFASSLTHKRHKKLVHSHSMSNEMKPIASIILGGGEGTRLFPLTLTRCKPAICFGGKYRLIDIPISQSIHAHCYKTFVLTQFLSSSLHHHIFQTYLQGNRGSESIEVITAEQKPSKKLWFQGTADAVRQNIDYLLECPVEYFLILSGDQLYDIDFSDMFNFARESDADMVIAALPVNENEAKRLGILKINSNREITHFHEKPQKKSILEELKTPSEWIRNFSSDEKTDCNYIGSMGIYLFKRKALVDLLLEDSRADFGKHLIPTQLNRGKAAAFIYNGYWEDVGTIQSFYNANMALVNPQSAFTLNNEKRPIFSYRYDLPPSQFVNCCVNTSIICDGNILEADEISHSILGPRSVVRNGSIIRNSYLMGNDYYQSHVKDHHRMPIYPEIGENCIISHAIIDKNVSIGKKSQLINKKKLINYDGENFFVRDGIIIVPRGATLPEGFIF